MKNIIIGAVVVVLLGVGVYFITQKTPNDTNKNIDVEIKDTPVVVPTPAPVVKTETIIGQSVNGNDIVARALGVEIYTGFAVKDVIVEGNQVKGVIFESKSGCSSGKY